MEHEKLFSTDCIRTFSGKYLDVFNPDPEQICIEDIAHALAFTCRFGGHTKYFYSVAQHSINVMHGVKTKGLHLQALMHDAAEAYLTDIPTPIKKRLPHYKQLEDNLLHAIGSKFGFDSIIDPEVKQSDTNALKVEWATQVINSRPALVLTPLQAEREFLMWFQIFTNNDGRR
jgi:hypothetical protein